MHITDLRRLSAPVSLAQPLKLSLQPAPLPKRLR